MNQTLTKHLVVFIAFAAACGAAEGTTKTDRESVQQRLIDAQPTPSTKSGPARIDPDAVVVADPVNEPKPAVVVPVAPADNRPKDPAAEAKAAAEAEKVRAADEASAFAKGEGERYARRQKAYEAARSLAPRPPVEPPKRSSIAELQMPDGRYIVMAGGDRRMFANKAEAGPYLTELRQAETDRPLVLGSSPAK